MDWDEIKRWSDTYNGQTTVVKTNHALAQDPGSLRRLANDLAYLAWSIRLNVIVVQGHAPLADGSWLLKAGDEICDAFREESSHVTVLAKPGFDDNLLAATPCEGKKGINGKEPTADKLFFQELFADKAQTNIPVVLPICAGNPDKILVDEDEASLAVAEATNASRLVLCSNKRGILAPNGKLISQIGYEDIDRLIRKGGVAEESVPALLFSQRAISKMPDLGVAHVDGRFPHKVLEELLTTQGGGTLVKRHVPTLSLEQKTFG